MLYKCRKITLSARSIRVVSGNSRRTRGAAVGWPVPRYREPECDPVSHLYIVKHG